MKPYADVMNAAVLSPAMHRTRKWLASFICRKHPDQLVVGNRKDNKGAIVRQDDFDLDRPAAHVCPFVLESIQTNHFWIEEAPQDSASAIERLLGLQIGLFKRTNPAHEPATDGGAPHPTYLKTFLTVFPELTKIGRSQFSVLLDPIFARLRPVFIAQGLMLGQFYAGCTVPAVYNPLWKGPLIAPYPSFAIRYMATHDHLFISQTSPQWATYKRFFP
jgi:hypothetical protein